MVFLCQKTNTKLQLNWLNLFGSNLRCGFCMGFHSCLVYLCVVFAFIWMEGWFSIYGYTNLTRVILYGFYYI